MSDDIFEDGPVATKTVRRSNFAVRAVPLPKWRPLPSSLCVGTTLSGLLPWVIVTVPGSGAVHSYSLMTGGGMTSFAIITGVPLIVGAAMWLTGMRSGLVLASIGATALAIVAFTTVVLSSAISEWMPGLGLFGSRFAAGNVSPGAGAVTCMLFWLSLALFTLQEVLGVRGIAFVVSVDWIVVTAILLVVGGDVASRLPWLTVSTIGDVALPLRGDGFAGTFLLGTLSWIVVVVWVLQLVVYDERLRIAASVLVLALGVARAAYVLVPWLSISALHSLLPDIVSKNAHVQASQALFWSLGLSLGMIVVGLIALLTRHRASGSASG
jgi:hypothetical protein